MSGSALHPDELLARAHVIPLDDFREHECSTGCWCHPRPLPDAPEVYVHRALDGRELYAEGKRMLQ